MNDFTRALPLIAMVLGNKLGINVTVGGSNAYTDGQNINIPVLPEDDSDSLVAVRGYLDHEAAHVRFTDMSATKPPGFVGSLLNLLEDIRIEHAMSGLYPGSKQNLVELADLMIRQNLLQLPDPDEQSELHPANIFCTWLNLKLQHEELGYPAIKESYEDVNSLARAVFPADLLDQISSIVDPVKTLASTHEVLKKAEDVVALIESYLEEKKEEQQKQKQNGSAEQPQSQPENGDGDALSSDISQQDESDQKDQKGGQQSLDGDSQPSEQPSSNGQQESDSSLDTLEQMLAAGADDLEDLDKGEMIGTFIDRKAEDLDGMEPLGAITLPDVVQAEKSDAISLESVLGTSSRLRTQLTGLIQSTRLKRHHPRHTGRRLDTRFINRIPLNDTRIFSSRQEKKAVNTAVVILLDCSSSMNHEERIEVAREATLAAAVGVDSIPGTSVGVGAFPSGYRGGVIEILPFGRSPRSGYREFGVQARGGTPMTEALWWGGAQLAMRSEPRKLIVVATDGEANSQPHARAAVERLTKNGIEVMGLGIKCDSVKDVFDDHRTIDAVEELPGALIGMLQSRLRYT